MILLFLPSGRHKGDMHITAPGTDAASFYPCRIKSPVFFNKRINFFFTLVAAVKKTAVFRRCAYSFSASPRRAINLSRGWKNLESFQSFSPDPVSCLSYWALRVVAGEALQEKFTGGHLTAGETGNFQDFS
jgi:hypothetical protein